MIILLRFFGAVYIPNRRSGTLTNNEDSAANMRIQPQIRQMVWSQNPRLFCFLRLRLCLISSSSGDCRNAGVSIIHTASQSFDMTCFHYGGPWRSSWCASCADLRFTSCNCQFIPVWTRGCGSLYPGTTATILRSSPNFGCVWFFTIFLWYNGNSIDPRISRQLRDRKNWIISPGSVAASATLVKNCHYPC